MMLYYDVFSYALLLCVCPMLFHFPLYVSYVCSYAGFPCLSRLCVSIVCSVCVHMHDVYVGFPVFCIYIYIYVFFRYAFLYAFPMPRVGVCSMCCFYVGSVCVFPMRFSYAFCQCVSLCAFPISVTMRFPCVGSDVLSFASSLCFVRMRFRYAFLRCYRMPVSYAFYFLFLGVSSVTLPPSVALHMRVPMRFSMRFP